MTKYRKTATIWLMIPVGIIFSQTVEDSNILPVQYGARAAAFADAYVSETNDIGSMYWNPAAVSHIQRKSILWDYRQEWRGKMKMELLAFPVFSGFTTTITAGVNGSQFTVFDPGGSERLASSYGIDLAGGVKFTPTFSAGLLTQVRYYSVLNTVEWSTASAFGLLYAPSPDISYGMMFSGIGESVVFPFTDTSVVLRRVQLPKRLHLGLTLRFPSSRSERIISIILSNDKIFGQTGIRYNGGIEWSLTDFFDLRTGYVVSPTYAAAKYGVGVRLRGIQFDYAISPSAATHRFHEMTFFILL